MHHCFNKSTTFIFLLAPTLQELFDTLDFGMNLLACLCDSVDYTRLLQKISSHSSHSYVCFNKRTSSKLLLAPKLQPLFDVIFAFELGLLASLWDSVKLSLQFTYSRKLQNIDTHTFYKSHVFQDSSCSKVLKTLADTILDRGMAFGISW